MRGLRVTTEYTCFCLNSIFVDSKDIYPWFKVWIYLEYIMSRPGPYITVNICKFKISLFKIHACLHAINVHHLAH